MPFSRGGNKALQEKQTTLTSIFCSEFTPLHITPSCFRLFLLPSAAKSVQAGLLFAPALSSLLLLRLRGRRSRRSGSSGGGAAAAVVCVARLSHHAIAAGNVRYRGGRHPDVGVLGNASMDAERVNLQ